MDGVRRALIVANDEYDDPGLRRLVAPAQDAEALADVLGDPAVGAFDVSVLYNGTTQEIRTAVEDFFVERDPDDLLLLHFSCHGLKNSDGRLFLALRDTRPNRLASSGLPADFVNEQMAASRAQRIALFLDCCYGGAFPRGMVVRAAGEAQVRDSFTSHEEELGGRARVVVTASNAMQYSFEAGALTSHEEKPSVFTGALVDALSTGEADRDGDGWIGLSELFAYVKRQVRRQSPDQNPQLWTFGAEGEILVARSRVRRISPTPLEPELAQEMKSPLAAARYGIVDLLGERLSSTDLGLALAAWQALQMMATDDSRKVSDAAQAALDTARLEVEPESLDLQVEAVEQSVRLAVSGPLLARAFTASVSRPWLQVEYDDAHVTVTAVSPGTPGEHAATLTLQGPAGKREIPVRVIVPVAVDPPEPVAAPGRAPSLPVDPPGSGIRPSPRRPWQRPTLVAGVAGAAAVLGVLASTFWMGGNNPGPGSPRPSESTSTSAKVQQPGIDLPRGPRLATDVVVWVAEGDKWRIEAGAPGRDVNVLFDQRGVRETWPALSPDRDTIVYLAEPDGSRDGELVPSDIRVVGTDGQGDRDLFTALDGCPSPGPPSWSPDGEQLVLVCNDQVDNRLPGILVVSLDGTVLRTLDEHSLAGAPTWSEDGRSIFYWVQNDYVVNQTPGTSLWAVPAGGGDPVRLTDAPAREAVPAVSPDGRWVAFARKTEGQHGFDIWLMRIREQGDNVTFGRPRRMAASAEGIDDHDPTWAPDSSLIVFSQDGHLMSVPPDVEAQAEPLFPDRTDQQDHMAVWSAS